MAKVIQFPGGPERQRPNLIERGDSPRLKVNHEKYVLLLQSLVSLAAQIVKPKRDKLIRENLAIVAEYTDEELIGWVENSNQSQWKSKPMFFVAVCQEIKKRNLF